MTSIAEKRRRKKAAKITLGDEVEIPQRIPTGRPRKDKADETATVTAARMRRTGITDPKDAAQPICGTDLGLCIRALCKGDELTELSNAWSALSASHRNYRLLYIGQTGNPQGAAIAMIPGKMESDQSLRVDLRSHEDKVAAAKASWAAWEAKIAALPVPSMRWAIHGALNGFLGEATLWKNAAPTVTGKAAVQALRALDK